MYAERLKETLPRVQERLERARERAGTGRDVDIVAVTKGHPPDAVRAAVAAGLRRVGENRTQELEEKVGLLGREAAEWHLIGHLQRNKVRRVLPLFELIHSVDSPRLARELSKEAEKQGAVVEGLLQVNTSGEASKGGFGADPVAAAAELAGLPGLRLVGVMTMAPLTDDERVLRTTFRGAREAFEACARDVSGFEARHLSMGMSNDFEIAVEEGATMVRLGTVLFGEREP